MKNCIAISGILLTMTGCGYRSYSIRPIGDTTLTTINDDSGPIGIIDGDDFIVVGPGADVNDYIKEKENEKHVTEIYEYGETGYTDCKKSEDSKDNKDKEKHKDSKDGKDRDVRRSIHETDRLCNKCKKH